MKRGADTKTGHRWYTPKIKGRGMASGSWLTYCWRCGLVALKNEATQKAIKAGCYREDDVVLDVTGPG